MKPNVRAHLQTAHEKLEQAKGMFSLPRYAGTVNRTYYVMFEAASAMLLTAGMELDTDYGVKIKFAELFVTTGKVDPKFGRYLSEGLELREDADYALDSRAAVPREVAEEQLGRASEFLAMAEDFLKGADVAEHPHKAIHPPRAPEGGLEPGQTA